MNFILIILLPIIGAVLYRWRGGGIFKWNGPRPLAQLLFSSFPCIILPVLFITATGWTWQVPVLVLAAIWAVAWECTGHGGFQDLGTWTAARDDERIEPLIKPLHGHIPEYWYDALGLALTGGIVTAAPGICLICYGHIAGGFTLALTGLLKAPGYMLGRAMFSNTESGELFSGGLRWGAAALILYFVQS